MTPPVFRVPTATPREGRVTLDGPEGHHAADVRRLGVGEPIWLTDGVGRRWEGAVGAVRRGSLDIDVSRMVEEPPPVPRLVAVQALAKGGRDESAIEAMTEVGVDEIVGWSAVRSIAKWTDRTAAKWQTAAAAAAKQARRSWWPQVTGPVSSSALATRIAACGCALLLHESADVSVGDVDLTSTGEVLVVIGPEGGIADDELSMLSAAGARPVRLGPTVLRSGTAGVVALAAICARTRWT